MIEEAGRLLARGWAALRRACCPEIEDRDHWRRRAVYWRLVVHWEREARRRARERGRDGRERDL